ncbi:Hypothetical protein, predicted transmembrane protein [Mycoplasma yeatsii 13926]|uniref:Transmembrane protein n=1 Tax=Mycoplasma yeatsii 13926 TaxID=1188240 RepID=S6G8A6_9MOLU|nr:hypothetical protein [Mycoplasma yeatsii]EOA07339.1 Hypothetical protein, predicted transmembrane protein [Mycoplasma yeatsii 13926]
MKKFLSILTISTLLLSTTLAPSLLNKNKQTNTHINHVVLKSENKIEKQSLDKLVTEKNIGDILKYSDQDIVTAINRINKQTLDIKQLHVKKIDDQKAEISAKKDSKEYTGSIEVTFKVNPKVKFKLDELVKVIEKVRYETPKLPPTISKNDVLNAINIANSKTTTKLIADQIIMQEYTVKNNEKGIAKTLIATISAKAESTKYEGSVTVKFNIVKVEQEDKGTDTAFIVLVSLASAWIVGSLTLPLIRKYKQASKNKKQNN